MRGIKIYTGVGGMDLFEEAMEEHAGLKRVYIGKKVPRILRKLPISIKKSLSGRYYRLISTKKLIRPEDIKYSFTSYRIAQ
jgi:hypothetical protein